MTNIYLIILIPTLLAVIGAVYGTYRKPGERFSSAVQHFAAGLVIAAVAEELVPEMTSGYSGAMVIGFVLGVGLMLGIKKITDSTENTDTNASSAGTMLLLAVGIDLSVDGTLLGLAVGQGLLKSIGLIVALTLEIGFLVLSTSATLQSKGYTKRDSLISTLGISFIFPVFALGSYFFLKGLSGASLVGAISFAVAALLYLVFEELLVEAHEKEDAPWITAFFFLGFLVIFII